MDIGLACGKISERYSHDPDGMIAGDKIKQLCALDMVRPELSAIGLRLSLKKLDNIYKNISEERIKTRGDLKSCLDELTSRIEDELESRLFMQLNYNQELLFLKSDNCPMGFDVDSKFPSAKYDIEEAYKCLAFGRATATAFHAMRVIEYGIKAVARCIGIHDPIKPSERNWGKVLAAIKSQINAKWPTPSDRVSGDGKLFEEIYVSLDAVKNPWRNATMHVENIYTEENAEHILSSVVGFMRKLVQRCDENGLPNA